MCGTVWASRRHYPRIASIGALDCRIGEPPASDAKTGVGVGLAVWTAHCVHSPTQATRGHVFGVSTWRGVMVTLAEFLGKSWGEAKRKLEMPEKSCLSRASASVKGRAKRSHVGTGKLIASTRSSCTSRDPVSGPSTWGQADRIQPAVMRSKSCILRYMRPSLGRLRAPHRHRRESP